MTALRDARETGRRAHWFYGGLMITHVSGAETDGRFCLLESLQPADQWTPLHVRRDTDLTQYVLEGELTVYLPDGSFVLGPGDCLNAPMRLPRTEHVTSAGPLRVLDFTAPAGFDAFVASAGEPAPEMQLPPSDAPPVDIERLAALAAEHGIEILGPPGKLP
jgi:mannose-6-phosphate isomerase-like protein (cupin superfamily)